MSESFDKAIMSLSGGALAISITFVHNVAPDPTNRGLLTTSWFLFAGSLLLILISFLTSQAAILNQIGELNGRGAADRSWWKRWLNAGVWTTVLNFLSAGAFVAGVIFLVLFARVNF
jgi:hypothetical protein